MTDFLKKVAEGIWNLIVELVSGFIKFMWKILSDNPLATVISVGICVIGYYIWRKILDRLDKSDNVLWSNPGVVMFVLCLILTPVIGALLQNWSGHKSDVESSSKEPRVRIEIVTSNVPPVQSTMPISPVNKPGAPGSQH
jgi:hypothetical protein